MIICINNSSPWKSILTQGKKYEVLQKGGGHRNTHFDTYLIKCDNGQKCWVPMERFNK